MERRLTAILAADVAGYRPRDYLVSDRRYRLRFDPATDHRDNPRKVGPATFTGIALGGTPYTH